MNKIIATIALLLLFVVVGLQPVFLSKTNIDKC